jgi:nucleoside-diphosphate-sugar epimerase
MELVDYQRNFPPDVAVPNMLRALLGFQNGSRNWYSDHFELVTWEYGQPAWFGGDCTAARQFIVFGHGPDGSLYALWLYPGRTAADAPVVFLGSEGTDCSLLAGDLGEFLSLLAIGADELGFAVSGGEIAEANSPAARLSEFREWLRASFGIMPSDRPRAVVFEARTRHPDFGAWLAAWQKSDVG